MVLVVENIQEGGCERMEIVKYGETLDDVAELFAACFLGEFDLSSVKGSNSGNLETSAD